jgi:quinol monooxygenase YgiN
LGGTEFVRRRKRVEHRGQAGIKNAIEGNHIDLHGDIDIKDVIIANGPTFPAPLGWMGLSLCLVNPIMEMLMIKLAFFARFEAKPGKEEAVAEFLEAALDMAKKEPTTINWYALRLSPSTFGVFDTFNNEDGRQRHLNGPIGQALMAKAPELFSSPPSIEPVEVLGYKKHA